jgi:hypothetical protein
MSVDDVDLTAAQKRRKRRYGRPIYQALLLNCKVTQTSRLRVILKGRWRWAANPGLYSLVAQSACQIVHMALSACKYIRIA